MGTPEEQCRIGILVVAYNAASTLASVIDRIPKDFRPKIADILVCDDHSQDSTYLVGLGYKQITPDLPLTVIRHPKNLGYGGNQKAGYRMAIKRGLDIIVLLHGDGQYAPECLPEIVAPLERGECDAVLGSRMMIRGAARRGGMPFYKYVGNKALTKMQNGVLGTNLSEFHSGYRAYSTRALASLPFEGNSNGFDFDTQILIQLHDAGRRIREIPIPTYYGDEICYVNGLKYARDVSKATFGYRFQKMGFGTGQLASVGEEYQLKPNEDSSHRVIERRLRDEPPSKILDLGCSGGALAKLLGQQGHHVTGIDFQRVGDVEDHLAHFVQADLEQGIPEEIGTGFDVVVAADVFEHVRDPARLLSDARRCLRPQGLLLASVPNFGHWYPRLRVAAGRFDYDQRGILDRTHLRFFSKQSFRRMAEASGFRVIKIRSIGLPFDTLRVDGRVGRALARADQLSVGAYPNLFAYQILFELEPGVDSHES
jgi:glycosyltransferase involved in cell wall biosynthesis